MLPYGGRGVPAGDVDGRGEGRYAVASKGPGPGGREHPRAESDRSAAWEHFAQLLDPENFDLDGSLAEVAGGLDRVMEAAYLRQLGDVSETDLLAALLVRRKVLDVLAEQEVYLIEAARKKGVTWERLAGALEVGGRQAAERRYTSLRQPMDADRSSARARIEANRDSAAEQRAARHFVMVHAREIQQLAELLAAQPELEAAATAAAVAEAGANPRRPAPIYGPSWPHRLRTELAKVGGGDPSVLMEALRQIPRPERFEHGELAVLAGDAAALYRRQHEASMSVMKRRWARRGEPVEDEDERGE